MKAKSTFLARNVLTSPALVQGNPNRQNPSLTMPVNSGTVGLNKPIIRWMSG
jgi:hypothetical protein